MGNKRNPGEVNYDCILFGAQLHACRLNLGWTAKQLALVYSECIGREDDPVTVTYIYRLEGAKDMLQDKGRRAILARIVGMPLGVAGISFIPATKNNLFTIEQPLDTKEYTNMLEIYCDTWQKGTTYKAAKDIQRRIQSLEHNVLYSSSQEKIELLTGYQIVAADLAAEQNTLNAVPMLTKAIQISRQGGTANIYAHSLRQRAGAYIDTFEEKHNYSILTKALIDFQAAEEVYSHLSPFYKGLVDVRRGLVYACLAQDQNDFKKGLHIIDGSSQQIDKQNDDTRVAAKLDVERYMFNRAAAFLYSPYGSPEQALKELDQATHKKPNTSPRRSVHRDLLYAETYTALKNYPMAVACVANAVEVSTTNGMDTLFNRLENVYQDIAKSDYRSNPEVARLGSQIFHAHHPEFFI